MDGIVHPAPTLLNSDRTPFVFVQESVLRNVLRNIGRENHMPRNGDEQELVASRCRLGDAQGCNTDIRLTHLYSYVSS